MTVHGVTLVVVDLNQSLIIKPIIDDYNKNCSGSWWGPSQLRKGSTVGWWFVMFLMINSAVFVIGSSSPSWWGPSQSKEGTSSLFGLGGALFRLPPICSWEELWFLVVLDTASLPSPATHRQQSIYIKSAFSLVLRALVMGMACSGRGYVTIVVRKRLCHKSTELTD